MKKKIALSLFCSSGIGDIALRKLNYDVIVANELIKDRCSIYKRNFPETEMVCGDIWKKKNEIINLAKKKINNKKLNLALVSPPCQGMSKNGRGKLLSEIKAGRRPSQDERNLLIIPAIEILKKLKPETIIFENVTEMKDTMIYVNKKFVAILDFIKNQLKEYHVEPRVVNLADYGIPQMRKRLITIATLNKKLISSQKKIDSLFPQITHTNIKNTKLKKWVTTKDAIDGLEKLDGKYKIFSDKDELHKVAKLDEKKYWWVSNTPINNSAFNNQCVKCKYKKNPLHFSKKNNLGVNQSSKDTPFYCLKCKSLLPRPITKKDGKIKIMRGFTSAYKRMDWLKPASTITRNFPYVCSDNKIHPNQNRSLSYREACILHTINKNDFIFESEKLVKVKDILIRDTLGESIPPKFLVILINHLENLIN